MKMSIADWWWRRNPRSFEEIWDNLLWIWRFMLLRDGEQPSMG